MAEQQSAQDKLFDAIQEADLERMKLCLENGAEINSKGCHIKTLELLKRRGPEYFTLVLTKNDSNLVAALSYCSDEGN